jgi:uncharacterized protein YjbI with pentapeptide repeats
MQKEITLQEIILSGKKQFIECKIINHSEEDVLHSFKGYNFPKCIFIGKFKGINLSDANLSYADLSNANLSCANLSCANLISTNLSYANLHRAVLIRTNLFNANLSGADLSRADLSYAILSYAILSFANLYKTKYNEHTKFPSSTLMLLAQWQNVSDDLCLELMRYDCDNLENGKKLFDIWINTNCCPYSNSNYTRAAMFYEKRSIWSYGESKNALTLLKMLMKEKMILID